MNCRGMALVTGLLMLAIVALLAVTAAGSMTLQQHQAANFSDRLRAANRAAVAESWALAWLYSRAGHEREGSCTQDCVLPPAVHPPGSLTETPELEGEDWWQTNGIAAASEPGSGESMGFASAAPGDALWLIEELRYQGTEATEGVEGVAYYRLLSRGRGSTPGNTVIDEAVVARPWGPGVAPMTFPPDQPATAFCTAVPRTVDCGIMAWRRIR